jgi:hypothetical protein
MRWDVSRQTQSTPRCLSITISVQAHIRRAATMTSPSRNSPHNLRSRPSSLCPFPAYRQIPRSRIAPHESEMIAATRATAKLVPGFRL